MRESGDVSLGSTKSFGGLVVDADSGFVMACGGSGVASLAGVAFGFERVRAIIMSSECDRSFVSCTVKLCFEDMYVCEVLRSRECKRS